VSTSGNVPTLPNDIWIESEDAVCPTLVAADCALENKLVDLEQKSLMVSVGVGRLRTVYARQNGVANSDQFGGSNWIGRQVKSQAIPVAMIDAYRGAVAR
jgi:hypothetical protein